MKLKENYAQFKQNKLNRIRKCTNVFREQRLHLNRFLQAAKMNWVY